MLHASHSCFLAFLRGLAWFHGNAKRQVANRGERPLQEAGHKWLRKCLRKAMDGAQPSLLLSSHVTAGDNACPFFPHALHCGSTRGEDQPQSSSTAHWPSSVLFQAKICPSMRRQVFLERVSLFGAKLWQALFPRKILPITRPPRSLTTHPHVIAAVMDTLASGDLNRGFFGTGLMYPRRRLYKRYRSKCAKMYFLRITKKGTQNISEKERSEKERNEERKKAKWYPIITSAKGARDLFVITIR